MELLGVWAKLGKVVMWPVERARWARVPLAERVLVGDMLLSSLLWVVRLPFAGVAGMSRSSSSSEDRVLTVLTGV